MMGQVSEKGLLRTGVPPLIASVLDLFAAAAKSDLAPVASKLMPARPAEVFFTNERRVRDGFMSVCLQCGLSPLVPCG